MVFNRKNIEKWHDWFAWKPVQISSERTAWLETVRRKKTYVDIADGWWITEYRSR